MNIATSIENKGFLKSHQGPLANLQTYWKTYPNIEACGTTRGHSGSFWWSSQGLLAALGIPGYLNICDPVWYPENKPLE